MTKIAIIQGCPDPEDERFWGSLLVKNANQTSAIFF